MSTRREKGRPKVVVGLAWGKVINRDSAVFLPMHLRCTGQLTTSLLSLLVSNSDPFARELE